MRLILQPSVNWKSHHKALYSRRYLRGYSAPPLLLVSFPGSGNTWLRFLTESLTGAFTGSIYRDAALSANGKVTTRLIS